MKQAPGNVKLTREIDIEAYKLHTLGYHMLPSGAGDRGKSPRVKKWKHYQLRQPSDAEFFQWVAEKPSLWGMVTGTKSGIVVIDEDTQEGVAIMERDGIKRHTRTPHGGHYYFTHPGREIKNAVRAVNGLDWRGDGGFVNVTGTNPLTGEKYTIEIMPTQDTLYSWDKMPLEIAPIINGNGSKPAKAPTAPKLVIHEGEGRNHACTTEAGRLCNIYKDVVVVEEMIRGYNTAVCRPPLTDQELTDTVFKSVPGWVAKAINNSYSTLGGGEEYIRDCHGRHETVTNRDRTDRDNRDKPLQSVTYRDITSEDIRQWVIESDGRYFSTRELDTDLSITRQKQKDNRRQIINRLKAAGEVEKHPKINSFFRYINTEASTIDIFDNSAIKPLPLRFPLGIEKFADIYPGNEIVIAGSPNAGKTALLLSIAGMNINNFPMPVVYFSSEMGAAELSLRLRKFEDMTEDEWLKIVWKERQTNFQDVIQDAYLNIIDYLEACTDLYLMADHLASIQRKATRGLTIVAIQKAANRDLGRGAEFSSEKPRLYLSMDPGKIKIVKVKNWHTTENPNGLVCNFKLVDGAKFIKIDDWHQEGY